MSPASPALSGGFFTIAPSGKPVCIYIYVCIYSPKKIGVTILIQKVPYIWKVKLQTFKDANEGLYVQSH